MSEKNEKYIDLHTHSTASDGTNSPSQVVKLAYEAGLAAVALTDHDTVDGVAEAIASDLPIEVVPGIELSAGYGDGDIHIVGLYIDHTSTHLKKMSEDIVEEREWRNREMAKKLSAAGIDISVEKIRNGDNKTVVTRAHFARYLEEHGYVKNKTEAFKQYLGTHTPYFVKRRYLTPEQCVQLILDCGGVPILAHPILYHLPSDELEELVIRLKKSGLLGIEAIYSTYSNTDEEIVRSIAHRHSLIISGGSDFHGSNKPDIAIGTGKGNLKVPYSVLTGIKNVMGC